MCAADCVLILIVCLFFQKEKLDAECEVADQECEIDWISACREGAGGEAEFHVYWSGGIDKWKGDATTWQALESDKVLAVWEKQGERERASCLRVPMQSTVTHGLQRCHSQGVVESSAVG